jgi:hypothetical protein
MSFNAELKGEPFTASPVSAANAFERLVGLKRHCSTEETLLQHGTPLLLFFSTHIAARHLMKYVFHGL